MIGVGKIKQYTDVLGKPLSKVSLSAFSFLFSELIQYSLTQVNNIAELERRETGGKPICWESYPSCTAQCGRPCSERFISIPKDMGTFNCGSFVAGIVRGVLDSAGFPVVITAHFVPVEGQQRPRTTILIKFAEESYSEERLD